MTKKCIICEDPAEFAIKGTNDFYCEECAKENFDDITALIPIEDIKPEKDAIDQLEELNQEK